MQIATFAVLGKFALSIQSIPITHFPTEKVRALFTYLALEPHLHRREEVAELFWPENPPGMALKNLRLSIYRLRQAIEAVAPNTADQLLLATRQTVGINPRALSVDVLRFQATVIACERHKHRGLAECESCLVQLQAAAMDYQGELLPGLDMADAPGFDEWLLIRRESLQNLAQLALQTLTANAIEQGSYQQALEHASQLLELDMYCEDNHRQVMTLLAYLNQQQRALAHYRQYCRILKQELDLEPSDETRVLMEQIQVGRVRPAIKTALPDPAVSAPQVLPSAQPAPISHNNLPAPLTNFVGRQHELAELSSLLARPGIRLLTLIGTGGMGKTRLALELAHMRAADYVNGVVFVALAPLNDPAIVASTIAAALELDMYSDPQEQACRYLRDKQLLLILDNAEHLLDSVGDICLALLESASRLQILVTSREALNMRGEYRYIVSVLAGGYEDSLESASRAPSVMMFVQSAQRSLTAFQITEQNMAHILRICQLVQGMPLGLELAAARVSSYSLKEIADSITENADFLAYNWRGVPQRQRSIRAVFDWSWQLLSSDEQLVLRQLAIFRGGFSCEAAHMVAQASEGMLIRLTQTSLLYQYEQSIGRRYSMHQLLHQFAIEQYTSPIERAAVEARHSSYYLHFLFTRERRLNGAEPRATAAEIQTEIDNVRQAWIWAVSHGQIEAIDQAANPLYQFYAITGQLTDRIQMFELACRTLETYNSADRPDSGQVQCTFGKLLGLYSLALARNLQNELAISIGHQALALRSSCLEGAALAMIAWGYALNNQGLAHEARDRLEQALELIAECQRSQQDSEMLGVIRWATHHWLAVMNTRTSNFRRAYRHALQAWEICQERQLYFGTFDSLCSLGLIALTESHLDEARRYYEQAYALISTISSRTGEWDLLVDLAEVHRLQGNYAQAYALIRHALLVAQELGNQVIIYLTRIWLLRLLCLMGDMLHATEIYQHLDHIDDDALVASQRMLVLLTLMIYAQQIGDRWQALRLAEQCWDVAKSYGHSYDQAYFLVQLGHARAALQQEDAKTAYSQALTIYETIGNPGLATEARAGLATIALESHGLSEACQIVETILPIMSTGVHIGLDEPFFVYLACHRVLLANHDMRATRVLQAAHVIIQRYCEQLNDDELRRSFLNRSVVKYLLSGYAIHQLEVNTDALLVMYQGVK